MKRSTAILTTTFALAAIFGASRGFCQEGTVPQEIKPPHRATIVVSALDRKTADERFLEGLVDSGLYRLADRFAREKLARNDLDPTERAKLTVGAIRNQTAWGLASAPQTRGQRWQQADRLADDFTDRFPNHPDLPLVQFQQAMASLAAGELALRESELVADPVPYQNRALAKLSHGIRQLRDLNETLTTRRTPADRADRAVGLENRVRFQLGHGYHLLGEAYPAESADRSHALTQATVQFERLSRQPAEDPLWAESLLQWTDVARLLGDRKTARNCLQRLARSAHASTLAGPIRAARIQLVLDGGNLDEALRLAERSDLSSSRLDDLRLLVFLTAWESATQANNATEATRWEGEATRLMRRIESHKSAYWIRRAQMRLARFFQTAAASGDLDNLVRAAGSAYLSGQIDEALATYDRAATLALEQGNLKRAYELTYAAATIEHKRNRFEQATRRCRAMALATQTDPQSAAMHLAAIENRADLVRTKPDAPIDSYRALLQEHLERWPTGPTADEVRWRLGRLAQHQEEWAEAIACYEKIAPTGDHFREAIRAMGPCWESLLTAQQQAGKPVTPLARQAIERFDRLADFLVQKGDAAGPAREATILAARLRLRYFPEQADQVQRRLARWASESDDPAWTNTFGLLRVAALAAEGKREAARAILDQIVFKRPSEILALLDQLESYSMSADPVRRKDLGLLRLSLVGRVANQLNQLTADQQQAIYRSNARALDDVGETAEAVRLYAELVKRYPDDPAIQEEYAALLAGRSDTVSLEAALRQWREVERRAKPGSPLWFRAKYATADLHRRLGRPDQARKILSLVEILHPTMGGPPMRKRFESLRRQLDKRRRPN